jgi:phage shock protein PspC (stress-responsive transcriptional regulator)
MKDKLYRSRSNAILAGVCGGLGEYFGIDSNLIRVAFILLAFAQGIGILIYLALWLIVPVEGKAEIQTTMETVRTGAEEITNRARTMGEEVRTAMRRSNAGASAMVGVLLVALGIVFLLSNLGIFWGGWLGFRILWPSILIIVGVAFLWQRFRGGQHDNRKS